MRFVVGGLGLLVFLTLAGCDCESNCEREYRDCLEDPRIEALECDIGYDQCLMSCPMLEPATAAPDGG